jgi:DNA-binding MltR family transcriptional regulator
LDTPQPGEATIIQFADALRQKSAKSSQRQKFKDRFSEHTEKGAALSAVAELDEALGVSLRAFMIESDLRAKICKEGAPLGNFGAKIQLAYLLGLVSKFVFHEFETVRDIRNKFAHRSDIQDFNHPNISSLCAKLNLLELLQAMPSEARESLIRMIGLNYDDLAQPSFAFMATCRVLWLVLGLETQNLPKPRSPTFLFFL